MDISQKRGKRRFVSCYKPALQLTGLLFYCLFSLRSLAQENDLTRMKRFGNILESIASGTEQPVDYSSLLERLQELEAHPVPINSASLEELQQLIMLNDFQIRSLYDYIREKGAILSPYELSYVYGFNREIVQQILPFITLDSFNKKNKTLITKPFRYGRHQLFLRVQKILELQDGYRSVPDSLLSDHPNSVFQGNPWRIYTRYGYAYQNRMAFGFTAEKDPGESFFKRANQKGFDFYSGFFQLKNSGHLKNLVIGDYEPRFGQGLTVWSGLNFGKSPEVLLTEKHQNKIRKYSSTNENRFFRGVAATLDLGTGELSVFVSSKKVDATPAKTDSLNNTTLLFSGLDETGLHATLSELAKRDALRETMVGANLNIKGSHFRLGTSFLYFHFDGAFSKGPSPSDIYDFTGNSGVKTGIDYKYSFHTLYLFGEMTFEPGHGLALIQGGSVPLSEQVMMTVLYRNYSRSFFPYYSNGFAESTHTQNEHGFYMGVIVKPFSKWEISSYIDLFSFPWLQWNTESPSYGRDFFIQTEFNPSERIQMSGRFQRKRKAKNADFSENMTKTAYHTLTRLRYQVTYRVLPAFKLRNRVEWVGFHKENSEEQGVLLFQDIIYKPSEWPLDFSFRYSVFDADSWETRIYAYENDLLYVFSVPAYYGKGTRTYLLIHTALNKHLDLWAKISRINFTDRETNGSGLNSIAAPHKSEIKLQARWKF